MNHLDQIKLQEVASKIQVVIFDTEGILVESCDTLFKVEPNTNLFDQFIFLESLADVFFSMETGSGHDFPEVEWTEQVNALFNLSFRKITEDKIQWVIFDKTADYQRLLGIQQSRNESAINEEVALLQKRVADMENQLLEFQNLELKRIQDFKNEFFAQVSHEMRTPLSSIAGLVSLIEANKQKLTTYLPAIRSTSLHLNSIVNDILDISKIEAGKLTFESIDFSLQDEVSNVISGFQFEAQQRETQLELELPAEATVLKSDPTRLKQILYNLVGNSLKFTKKGKVALQIAVTESNRGQIKLRFSLTDSGLGMTPTQMSKVLEPYAQAQDSTAREFGGTGLGLGIAIKLVEAFGGQLEIKSELGVGTAMTFELSFTLGHLEHRPIEVQPKINGLKILLAEDDPVNQAILKEFLRSQSVDLVLVRTGRALKDSLNSGAFDLVISDVQLGDSSGIDILKSSREMGISTPFLFISGDSSEKYSTLESTENWQWIQKPIDLALLCEKIMLLSVETSDLKIDLSLLERTVGGDKVFLGELLKTIYETLPQELASLTSALEMNEQASAKKILHKIRPSIDYLGIATLSFQREELHKMLENEMSNMVILKPFYTFKKQAIVALAQLKEYL